jgi:hypothetical protein
MVTTMPDKKPPTDTDADDKIPQERAGERRRDEEREVRGPAYHGGDWSKADEEHGREALDLPAEEEVAGKGVVDGEQDDEPTARKT